MTLTVLTDDQIRSILENLTPEELQSALDALRSALHEYSTGTASQGGSSSIHQPHRTSVSSAATGATTLFMPSSSSLGTGIKVITLSSTSSAPPPPDEEDKPDIKPTGAITLFSPYGTPVGFLHASTLTAFRTALASLSLVWLREKISTLTVFGTGEQAYWHVRLTLMLRGGAVKRVHFVNRRFSDSCREIMSRFLTQIPEEVKRREGWPSRSCEFGVLTRTHSEYERLLHEQILKADVIFCCTPSTEPLWDGTWTTKGAEGRKKGRLIVAIGSWTEKMREIPPEVIRQAVEKGSKTKMGGDGHHPHRHWHKHAVEGGVVVVDTLDGALKEAGELIEAKVGPEQLVELGELVMLRKIIIAEHEEEGNTTATTTTTTTTTTTAHGSSEGGSHGHKKGDAQLANWLQRGNVIYKSVGLGLMDLTVGMHVVELSVAKGIGSHIEGF